MKTKLGLLLMIMGACSQAKADPQHYVCYPENQAGAGPTYYMVAETATGEFLLFDGRGIFVNRGQWTNNFSYDKPKEHFTTNINGISLFLNLEDAENKIWQLVMFKEGYDPAVSYCF